ncbi:MAG: hypothetical protein IJ846_00785 [Alphaproteobacteria bacterium]|nr:hypothetical protein [Alphaproteobacteria bacterium]
MSSAKVTSGAPVGHSTSVAKLNSFRSATVASAASSISAVNDSANIGSATDQYLLNGEEDVNSYLPEDVQENPSPLPFSPLSNETSSSVQLQFQENKPLYLSLQEVNHHIESYERTIEQSDEPLKKKTQGFG